ncbi:unnamed protein product [Dovyalis caffra]|uniref:Exostosin GT47 domain-containing protein n=1 Tax=Dovyalis caffra TaxID=77055 RepID=A0AAV1SP08_9ROSI|nr:unnamed protein product [Dovyalis caffra]
MMTWDHKQFRMLYVTLASGIFGVCLILFLKPVSQVDDNGWMDGFARLGSGPEILKWLTSLFLIPVSFYSLPAAGRSEDERAIAVDDFVNSLISKYPYWYRTLGTDHLFVTCADIHVTATARIANFLKNSIRVRSASISNGIYLQSDLMHFI